MKNLQAVITVTVIFLFGPTGLLSQDKNLFDFGYPEITQYTPQDYQAHSQTWGITQDSKGRMYFGSSDGVLQYDGVNWNLIQTTTRNRIISFEIDEDGIIFGYGTGDFGYLEEDSTGATVFRSLIRYLVSENDVPTIRDVMPFQRKVYFQARKALYVWDKQSRSFTTINSDEDLFSLKVFENQLYVFQKNKYVQVVNNTFQPSDFPFTDVRLQSDITKVEDVWYYATDKGIFIYDGESSKQISQGMEQEFEHRFYNDHKIFPDRRIAVATGAGLFLLDAEGNVILKITEDDGLKSSRIHDVFIDNVGAVWVTSDQGIARLSFHLPFRTFDKRNKLPGIVNDILSVDETLYVTTHDGTFWHDKLSGFQPVFSPNIESFKMLAIDGDLLILTSNGIFLYDRTRLTYTKVLNHEGYKLFRSRIDPEIIYICAKTGLHKITFRNRQVISQTDYTMYINELIRFIEEDSDGNLWLGSTKDPLYYFDMFSKGTKAKPVVTKYTDADGLPVSEIKINRVNNEFLFSSLDGVFQFEGVKFLRHPDFLKDNLMTPYIVDSKAGGGGVYLLYGNTPFMKLVAYKTTPDGFMPWDKAELNLFESSGLWMAYEDSHGIIWMGTTDGLIAYNQNYSFDLEQKFNTLLTHVYINDDSLVSTKNELSLEIPVAFNSLKFSYAIPAFDLEDNNSYQVKLIGLNSNWSSWTNETLKEYTNLSFGDYTFLVRGKDAKGITTPEASFSFSILRPWYWSMWFITLMSLAGLTLIVTVVRYFSTIRLKTRVRELEVVHKIQKERERISRNLHDDVGAQLTSIISGIKIAENFDSVVQNKEIKDMMASLKEDAEESISNLRDTIWTLNKEAISIEDFQEYIESHALSLFKYSESLNFHMESTINNSLIIKPIIAFNLKKVIQECLHNVMKHAKASDVQIILKPLDVHEIEIRVEDDGIGFNENELNQDSQFGLKNMKNRMGTINGKISFENGIKKGTSVRLTVPI